MTRTDFERNDGLDGLSAADLERIAFDGAPIASAVELAARDTERQSNARFFRVLAGVSAVLALVALLL